MSIASIVNPWLTPWATFFRPSGAACHACRDAATSELHALAAGIEALGVAREADVRQAEVVEALVHPLAEARGELLFAGLVDRVEGGLPLDLLQHVGVDAEVVEVDDALEAAGDEV